MEWQAICSKFNCSHIKSWWWIFASFSLIVLIFSSLITSPGFLMISDNISKIQTSPVNDLNYAAPNFFPSSSRLCFFQNKEKPHFHFHFHFHEKADESRVAKKADKRLMSVETLPNNFYVLQKRKQKSRKIDAKFTFHSSLKTASFHQRIKSSLHWSASPFLSHKFINVKRHYSNLHLAIDLLNCVQAVEHVYRSSIKVIAIAFYLNKIYVRL